MRIIILIVFLTLTMSISGCSKDNDNQDTDRSITEETKSVTIDRSSPEAVFKSYLLSAKSRDIDTMVNCYIDSKRERNRNKLLSSNDQEFTEVVDSLPVKFQVENLGEVQWGGPEGGNEILVKDYKPKPNGEIQEFRLRPTGWPNERGEPIDFMAIDGKWYLVNF